MLKKKRLGDRLVEAGIIDKLQLRAALGQQAQWGKTLGRTLLEMRLISEEQLLPILSEQLNMPAIDLQSRRLNLEAVALLDEEFCRAHECIPFDFHEQGKFLDVAMTDAQSAGLFDQIRVQTRCNVRPFLAGPEAIRNAIDQAFGEDVGQVRPQFMLTETVFEFGDKGEPDDDDEDRRPAGPSVAVVATPSAPAPTGAAPPPPRERRMTPGQPHQQLVLLRRQVAALQQQIQRQDRMMHRLVEQLRGLFSELNARGVLGGSDEEPARKAAPAQGTPATELPPIQRRDSTEIDVDVIFEGVDLDDVGAADAPAIEQSDGGMDIDLNLDLDVDVEVPGEMPRRKPRPAADAVKPATPPAELDRTLPLVHVPPGATAVVAMDLGTTRSSVAAVVDGQVSVLKLPGGDWDMPSVVGFRQDGSVMLGKAARKMLASDPENAIASPKRLLGRRFDERALQPYLASLGMKSARGPRGEVMLEARGKAITVTEACAHILNLLRLVAEKNLGREVHEVILTTPVSFTDRQYTALGEAAELANLRVVEFVDEPVAATLACVSDPFCKGLVAVFDFGGGTFDFSVVDVGAEVMEVITSAGDAWLGGDDFDQALASSAANGFWQQTKIELRNQAYQWQRLVVRAEATKRELSEQEAATLELKGAALTKEGTIDLQLPITREQLADLSKEIIQRALDTCGEALELNDLKPNDLSAVYLSGGTTYIPAVRTAVAEYFGKDPRIVVPPERAVLIGAAVHGALCPAEAGANT